MTTSEWQGSAGKEVEWELLSVQPFWNAQTLAPLCRDSPGSWAFCDKCIHSWEPFSNLDEMCTF